MEEALIDVGGLILDVGGLNLDVQGFLGQLFYG